MDSPPCPSNSSSIPDRSHLAKGSQRVRPFLIARRRRNPLAARRLFSRHLGADRWRRPRSSFGFGLRNRSYLASFRAAPNLQSGAEVADNRSGLRAPGRRRVRRAAAPAAGGGQRRPRLGPARVVRAKPEAAGTARTPHARGRSRRARERRQHRALRRPVRHGVGNHVGDEGHQPAWQRLHRRGGRAHRRSAGGHRYRHRGGDSRPCWRSTSSCAA